MKNYLKLTLDFDKTSSVATNVNMQFDIETVADEKDFTISKDKYIPKNRDNIFFLAGVNIPRVKIKNLTLNHRIKSIRHLEKADAIFVNSLTFGKMVDPAYYYILSKELFENYFEAMKEQMDSYQIDKIETALEFNNENIILFDYVTRAFLHDDTIQNMHNSPLIANIISSTNNEHFNTVSYDNGVIFKHLSDKIVFNETDLIEILNGNDALTINDESRLQLEEMLSSDDIENHTLAMEIMANSEYKSSLLQLMILFEKFSNVFMASSTRNHVNFKSLLSYLELTPLAMRITIDKIMALFIDREVLTEEWTDVILKRWDDRIRRGESEYFKCHTVTLSDKALAYLNINYKRQLNEDFIPAIIEYVEEEEKNVSSSIKWL